MKRKHVSDTQDEVSSKSSKSKSSELSSSRSSTINEDDNVRCWCSHLHRLAYLRLLGFAATKFDLDVNDLRKMNKRELCHWIADKMNLVMTDNDIKDDIIRFLDDSSQSEIQEMDEMRNPVGGCESSFAIDEEGRRNFAKPLYPLNEYMDSISQQPLTDFVRLLPQDKVLFNWSTLRDLTGGKHPLTGVTLPRDFAEHVETSADLGARLASLRKEWGFDYHPRSGPRVSQDNLSRVFRQVNYRGLSPPRPDIESFNDPVAEEQRALEIIAQMELERKRRTERILTEFSPLTLLNASPTWMRGRTTMNCLAWTQTDCFARNGDPVSIKSFLMHLFPQLRSNSNLVLREGKTGSGIKRYFWSVTPLTNNSIQVIVDLGPNERKWVPSNGAKPIQTTLNGSAPASFYVNYFCETSMTLRGLLDAIRTTLSLPVQHFELEKKSGPLSPDTRIERAFPREGKIVKSFLKCVYPQPKAAQSSSKKTVLKKRTK